MLTITPPETRDDEIQVDETERDSFMLKLSPTRLNAKRKERNARGFNYIQLIVGMIIFVALSRIVGPPAFRMITRARSTALSANIQTAAETIRNVIAIEPGKRAVPTVAADITAGKPTSTFLAALTDDAPFNWVDEWTLVEGDDSDTVRVQFLAQGADTLGTGAAGPQVGWLLTNWDAVRIQSRNQDGAWACALIVLKPNAVDGDETSGYNSTANEEVDTDTPAAVTANHAAIEKQLADARLRGVWYDSGETDSAELEHCDPVGDDGTASGNISDPIPEAADKWTIPDGSATAFRTLTRNI